MDETDSIGRRVLPSERPADRVIDEQQDYGAYTATIML